MDSLTHNVRRANWLNIINQCQERPANVTVRQWLKDNDINEKSYYYWLRKFRKESYDQMQIPAVTENPTEISFFELAAPKVQLINVNSKMRKNLFYFLTKKGRTFPLVKISFFERY